MKKKLLTALSYLLVAALTLAGTIAYFTDTDSEVNVMTVGNIAIEQIEQQRNVEGNLERFTQGKLLMPAHYEGSGIPLADPAEWVEADNQAWAVVEDNENVIDKFVTVKNTGRNDAFVRTVIAYEGAPFTGSDIHIVTNTTNVDPAITCDVIGPVVIDGVRYEIGVYTYPVALAAGEISIPSLKQIYMNKNTEQDDVAQYGGTYEVLVASQAVQADMNGLTAAEALDAAFGAITATNHPWADGKEEEVAYVTSAEELDEALKNGAATVFLADGEYSMPASAKGKTLTVSGTEDAVINVIPAGQGEANGQLDYNLDGSTVTFNGVTIKTNSNLYAGYARMSGTYNNCTIQNTYNLGLNTVNEFNGCEINITNEYLRVGGAKRADFNNCTFNTDGRAILVFQDGTNLAQTVTVKDCTFNATQAAYTWDSKHVSAVSIDGTNGTYAVNLEGTNFVDADFNGLSQIKAGEANVTVNDGSTAATLAATNEELKAALSEKDATVYVSAGTYEFPAIAEGATIIGEEGTVFEDTLSGTLNNVTVKNVEITAGNAQRWAYSKGDLVFEDCTFNATGVYAIHYDGLYGANITYKNCTIIGWAAIGSGAGSLTFDGCEIYGNGSYGVIRSYSDATIRNCTFDVADVNTTDGYQDGIHAVDCTITVENCTNVNGAVEDLFNISGTGVINKI